MGCVWGRNSKLETEIPHWKKRLYDSGVLELRRYQRRVNRLRNHQLGIYAMIILALVVLGGLFHMILRDTLLQNAQDMGTTLACSYISDENSNIEVYETLVQFATNTIDDQAAQGESTEEIVQWMKGFDDQLQGTLGEGQAELYAVVKGELIAPRPGRGMQVMNTKQFHGINVL